MDNSSLLENLRQGLIDLNKQLININAEMERVEKIRNNLMIQINRQEGAIEGIEMVIRNADSEQKEQVED